MRINTNFSLLNTFTARDINTRYKGSILGLAWNLVTPLALLVVYAFIFTNIFRTKVAGVDTDHYVLFLALALWPWLMLSDGVMKGMAAITANASLIKKTALPHFVLVAAAVLATFLVHLAGFVVVLAILAFTVGGIHWQGMVGSMVVIVALFMFTLGIAGVLAALQTIIRDVEQVVTPTLMMLQFLTPILYPLAIIPEPYRDWLSWNPLSLAMTRLRGHFLGTLGLGLVDLGLLLGGAAVLGLGYLFFARLSPHLEDFV